MKFPYFLFLTLSWTLFCHAAVEADHPTVTSVFLSQHFINEQLKAHVKPGLLRDLKVDFDTKHGQIFLRGLIQVPVEELRLINVDPDLKSFRFQVTIKPETTPNGYLILEFPLNETFFYPANSKNPTRDRIVIPVQMLSLALASARGYFSALSGDYSAFNRKTAKLQALVKALNKSIAAEKNPDAQDAMINEREGLKLQLAAVPIERKQLQALSKTIGSMLGFTGEKDLNLNDAFAARQNALIIQLNLAKFTPYLHDVSLGGVRVIHDARDGIGGENYFSIDINADLAVKDPKALDAVAKDEDEGLKIAPSAIIRIHQAMFESELAAGAGKKAEASHIADLKMEMKEDGLHCSGRYKRFFFSIPFDTIVDLDTVEEPDSFDLSVRDIQVAGIDFEFMTGFVLEMLKDRFSDSLKGILTFDYIGEQKDHSRALRAHIKPSELIPALPGLHLLDVEVRDREFLLKVGKI